MGSSLWLGVGIHDTGVLDGDMGLHRSICNIREFAIWSFEWPISCIRWENFMARRGKKMIPGCF